jgi:hypothetical protein
MSADTLAIVQFAWRCLASGDAPTLLAMLAISLGRFAPSGIRGQC